MTPDIKRMITVEKEQPSWNEKRNIVHNLIHDLQPGYFGSDYSYALAPALLIEIEKFLKASRSKI